MKHILHKVCLAMLCLVLGIGSAWAEDPVYTLQFTKLTTGTNYNNYTASHSITSNGVDWDVFGNQSLGNYLRVGGKNTSATNRTLTSTGQISATKAISKISISHNGVGNGSNSSITVNSIKVEGSTANTFTSSKSKTIASSSVSSAGTIDFVLDEGEWDANSYYKITVNYQITGSNNCYLTINEVKFYGASDVPVKSLSSIAVKTAPTKVTYTEEEFFAPAGLVVTKTFDDDTTEDVSYASSASAFTFTPSLTTALQTSDASVQISVGGKSTTQAITVNAISSHTAHFSINGVVNKGDDQIVKEGRAIVFPADPADINGKTFMGWTKTADYSDAEVAPSDICKAANMGNADVTYYAVFATKETSGVEVVPGTVVVSWPIENVAKDGTLEANVGSGTLSPSFALGSANAYAANGTAGNDTYVLLSDLDLSAYSTKTLKMAFFSRASAGETATVSYKNAGDAEFSELATTAALNSSDIQLYTVNNIPSTATSIKVKYNGTSGSFFFGSCRISTVETGSYQFEKLTASNTEGWTEADWDGYYLITNGSTNAFDGNAIQEKGYTTVSDVDGVITMTNVEAAFKVEYTDASGYSVKGVGANKFLTVVNKGCGASDSPTYYQSIGYNHLKETTTGSFNRLCYNASKFAFYTSAQGSEPTLYRINSTTTISDYCTIVSAPAPTTGTFRIGTRGFGTYCTDHAYVMPEDVKGGVYTMNGDEVELVWLYDAGWTVPANEAVLLKGAAGEHKYTIDNDDDNDPLEENLLKGCVEETAAWELTEYGWEDSANDEYYFYKLSASADGNGYGWYWGAAEGASFTCAANKCVLVLGKSVASSPQRALILIGDETLTSIDAIEATRNNAAIFDLQGRRVRNTQNGVYVVNGKKVIR